MRFARCTNEGNPYLGLFGKTNEEFTIIGSSVGRKFEQACDVLGTRIIRASVFGSPLIGVYICMNANGIIAPDILEKEEERVLKGLGLNLYLCKDKRNALGNNIVANDFGAVANEEMEKKELKKISDCLGVPVERFALAGYKTVGSACIATNKGFLAHNDATREEIKFLESVLKVRGGIGTANMGTPFVGIGVLANSKGCVVGELTSSYEMGRIGESLGFL